MSEEPEKITFDDFKEFYERHPDMDNAEYYSEFPNANKSTIRSWKNKLRAPPPTPNTPPSKNDDMNELQEEYIKILLKQTGTDSRELEGLDNTSKIMLLKNKAKVQGDKPEKRGPNSNILPSPAPIGGSTKEFGIDEFIEFDTKKDEIRMQIPMDHILDPEKNKKLGLLSRQ